MGMCMICIWPTKLSFWLCLMLWIQLQHNSIVRVIHAIHLERHVIMQYGIYNPPDDVVLYHALL